jgi:hypothetical protein
LPRVVFQVQRHCRRDVPGGDSGSRSLERAVDRYNARAEEFGDFGRLPPQDLSQDQHRALTGGQVLERGGERDSDGFSGRRQLGGIVGWRCRAAVPERVAPRVLREPVGRDGVAGKLRSEVHREWLPLSTLEHVEAHVGGDPVQPRPNGGSTFELVKVPPCPQDRFLDRVLGLEHRAQHPVAVSGQRCAVMFERG